MTDHVSFERMNDALDGLLPSSEMAPIERHLEACAACRNDFAGLSETVRAVSSLPREARAPDDAWEAIASRIDGEAPGVEVEKVPVYRLPVAERSRRLVTFSVPQLAAAGIAVALVSASLMWVALTNGGVDGPRTVAAGSDFPGGAAARAVSLDAERYGEVVGQLEEIIEQGREMLTPETLRSIEESLATIDAAIEEIDVALATDPGSDLLRRMLANHQRTRLGVLQRAAAAVQAQT